MGQIWSVGHQSVNNIQSVGKDIQTGTKSKASSNTHINLFGAVEEGRHRQGDIGEKGGKKG